MMTMMIMIGIILRNSYRNDSFAWKYRIIENWKERRCRWYLSNNLFNGTNLLGQPISIFQWDENLKQYFIGKGKTRSTYIHPQNKDWVVKITHDSKGKANFYQYHLWEITKNTPYAKYFLPCIAISEDCTQLIMPRAKPADRSKFRLHKHVPHMKFPSWFSDYDSGKQWGVYNDKYYLFDYGNSRMMNKYEQIHDRRGSVERHFRLTCSKK